ncbi:Oidioi.mRNA.OKI2018_I69.chr1.g1329.t1.cds [Oikopleura dioica]|uniref:Oidioi.mRNA.OKI2018_I69.chr1.g1329.t1.cds n=1 Tax=Oikopleura dioica TaxID=34765 RepID=A0ABN7SRD0_OIKDI|nr:Oidioi.mRNA.OKI2018_I69.chr1.g1329.t1.cds [Oikopleura dioica]
MKIFYWKIFLPTILQLTTALEINDEKNPSGTIEFSTDESIQFSSLSGASSVELVTSFPRGCGRKDIDFLQLKVKEHQSNGEERVYKGCSGSDFPPSIKLPVTVLISSSNWTSSAATMSYFFSSRSPPGPRLIGCSVSFSSLSSKILQIESKNSRAFSVLCPAGCAGTDGGVFGDSKMGFDSKSSICRSGIHAGEISDRFGGILELRKVPAGSDDVIIIPGSTLNSIKSLQTKNSKTNFIPIGFLKEPSKCGNKNILKVDLEKIKTSSFLKAFLDKSDPEMTPVETVLNWKGENAFSNGAFPWAPAIEDRKPWIQVDFNGLMRLERIETKGSDLKPFPWSASKFEIQIYKDGEWTSLEESFSADIASSSHTFMTPLLAEKIRLYPEAAVDSPVPAMNILFYGCEAPLPPHDNSAVLIAVIIALAGVALILALVSLLLIRRTKSKEAKFSKTVFRAPNIYTQNPMDTIQNMKYVSYTQPNFNPPPLGAPQNHPGRMFNPPYSEEQNYNIPFIHHARKMTTLPPAPAPFSHEYSDLETLPIKKQLHQNLKDSSYDDHTYSTLG